MKKRPIATVNDLNKTQEIDGIWYHGTATAVRVGNEYETRVVWHKATWKEVARARRELNQ